MPQNGKESIGRSRDSAGIVAFFHRKRASVDRIEISFWIRTKLVQQQACSRRDISFWVAMSSLNAAVKSGLFGFVNKLDADIGSGTPLHSRTAFDAITGNADNHAVEQAIAVFEAQS